MMNKFDLKIIEGMPIPQILNNFNSITNKLSYVEIEYEDEIWVSILLASLLNSWGGHEN